MYQVHILTFLLHQDIRALSTLFVLVRSLFLDSSMPGASVQIILVWEVHTKFPSRAYVSDYKNLLGDDNFSQRLLRPWSLASHDDGDLPTSARVSALDETWRISEETYPRRRLKSLGAWARYPSSARENLSSEGQFAINKGGWWNQQMLVDRSLRSMAALRGGNKSGF